MGKFRDQEVTSLISFAFYALRSNKRIYCQQLDAKKEQKIISFSCACLPGCGCSAVLGTTSIQIDGASKMNRDYSVNESK